MRNHLSGDFPTFLMPHSPDLKVVKFLNHNTPPEGLLACIPQSFMYIGLRSRVQALGSRIKGLGFSLPSPQSCRPNIPLMPPNPQAAVSIGFRVKLVSLQCPRITKPP